MRDFPVLLDRRPEARNGKVSREARLPVWLDHLSAAAIQAFTVNRNILRGYNMRKIFAAGAITLAFAPSGAVAQERVGDAALGALSGAVVLGPVGAVAGAVVGYTAGPSIAHSWRTKKSSKARNRASSSNAASNQGPQSTMQSGRAQNAIPPAQTLE